MEFDLLQTLLPHEISKYVIESLETRISNEKGADDVHRLSDHRPLFVTRNVLKYNIENAYSASCRLGQHTIVLGQLCIRPTQSKTLGTENMHF